MNILARVLEKVNLYINGFEDEFCFKNEEQLLFLRTYYNLCLETLWIEWIIHILLNYIVNRGNIYSKITSKYSKNLWKCFDITNSFVLFTKAPISFHLTKRFTNTYFITSHFFSKLRPGNHLKKIKGFQ